MLLMLLCFQCSPTKLTSKLREVDMPESPADHPFTGSATGHSFQEAVEQGMGEAIPPALISSLTFNYFSKFRVSQAGHTPVMLSTASEFFPLAHQRPHCTQLPPPLTILPHQALLDIANVCEEVAHRCDLRDRGKKKRKKKKGVSYRTGALLVLSI